MNLQPTKLALTFPGSETVLEDFSDTPAKATTGIFGFANQTPGNIINTILPFVFVIAGLALFFMVFSGGFTIFMSSGDPEKIKKGQASITNGLIGFAIMFAAYWIIQLLEISFNIKVF